MAFHAAEMTVTPVESDLALNVQDNDLQPSDVLGQNDFHSWSRHLKEVAPPKIEDS